MQSVDPVWTCCACSKLFKKCWQAEVYTRRTCAGLGILCPFATSMKSDYKHDVSMNPVPYTDWFDGDAFLSPLLIRVRVIKSELLESTVSVQNWCLRFMTPWQQQTWAGHCWWLLFFFSFFPTFFILFSCFPATNSSCGLSPLSMFSTKCPQVIVLLNLRENLKLRH